MAVIESTFEPSTLRKPASARQRSRVQTLPIRFIGSGAEYGRIWAQGLLLTLLTFSLYWPFARAHRIAWFQRNTLIDDDPLSFHGDPWTMLRSHLVMVLLAVAYAVLANTVPVAAAVMLVAIALLWPLVWRASLQYRLRNTSWRGVRLRFVGDRKGAYLALLPFLLPALPFLMLVPVLAADQASTPARTQGIQALLGSGLVLSAALLPWCYARLKRYQQGGYQFAGERTELRTETRRFYGIAGDLLGVLLLGIGAAVALRVLIAMGGGSNAAAWVGSLAFTGVLLPLLLLPMATASLQNLVWSRTRSRHARFRSDLNFDRLFCVTALNGLLTLLTLGAYWPFAQVRTARTRLEAMALQIKGDGRTLLARAVARQGDGPGTDFAAAFDVDLGL